MPLPKDIDGLSPAEMKSGYLFGYSPELGGRQISFKIFVDLRQ
jgi:hypothetical protein